LRRLGSRVGNVWARFIDGTLYADLSGRDADFNGVRRLPAHARALDLPATRTAITGNSLEWWWPDSSLKIGGWLKAAHYDVTKTQAKLTHQDLQGFSDAGVFFWQTHGGEVETRKFLKDASGNVVTNSAGVAQHLYRYSLMTSNTLKADKSSPTTEDERKMLDETVLTLTTVPLTQGIPIPANHREHNLSYIVDGISMMVMCHQR